MYKFEFKTPTSSESDEDILMHNLREADRALSLTHFTMIQQGWFKLPQNKNANYYDFELFLRKHNFSTHLFAKKPRTDLGFEFSLVYPNTKHDDEINKQIKYECIYSCRPKQFAIKEILSVWPTLEDNLEALKISGQVVVDIPKEGADMTKADTVLSDQEMEQSELLSSNKVKLVATYITAQDALAEIIGQIKKETGSDPEHCLVGMYRDGSPIMGLFVDKKRVSDIGYRVYYDKYGHQKMTLFSFN